MSKRTPALGFIFITVLIDIIGLGIVIPIFPDLFKELGGLTYGEAARVGGRLVTVYAVMQFIFSPILGGLSDKYGRRPVILISLIGLSIDYMFLALAPTISLLFLGRLIAGICGANFTTASAYIADVSPPEKRAKNFGLLGAAFALGFIIGPAIGGLLGGFGLRVPFFVAGGLTLVNFLYGLFILPESLSKHERRPFSWKRANPIGSLSQLKRNPIILGLATAFFFIYIASHSIQTNWSYFGAEVFDWKSKDIGPSLAVVGVMVAAVQGGLIGVATKKLGVKKTAYLGLFFNMLGLILFSITKEVWMLYTFLAVYVLGGLATPTIQGIMSSQLPNNEQGELQGGLTSLMSLAAIFGPIIMTETFFYFTEGAGSTEHYFPGAPFALGAVFSAICFFLVFRVLQKTDDSSLPNPEKDKTVVAEPTPE
ncbi:TCR/Tet family MFS transporter [Roseivirga pacifica]|uniref:TCR/Tet family MFS transporter n=1 Tax=Roseivirga pacifica TaxID=1267423 RepID=UPI00209467A4|nr:TCR/Tet family MFS transporter [Roseivirga pacifica]MCO6360695.1 MFS transporter [Roseivirga pacifica]MCO6368584.1 MFS transporter [Roseivirga pacifica]MCO6372726.1 MFS transporter [Roseivirga pacifica]MCO6376784.1 MFS transporter [Roseivirga pacifica]MCO6377936.1 MFS transporter [Roseivirga pacifica]